MVGCFSHQTRDDGNKNCLLMTIFCTHLFCSSSLEQQEKQELSSETKAPPLDLPTTFWIRVSTDSGHRFVTIICQIDEWSSNSNWVEFVYICCSFAILFLILIHVFGIMWYLMINMISKNIQILFILIFIMALTSRYCLFEIFVGVIAGKIPTKRS